MEDLISRIIALEELFGTPADDPAEQGRRTELTRYAISTPPVDLCRVPPRKLRDIEARFQSLYKKPPPHQLQDYGDILNLLEYLREVVFDYRVSSWLRHPRRC